MLTDLIGLVLLALAAVVYSWALWLFLTRGRGTPLPFAPPRHFVATGPYRYTRNPMALSVVVGAAGASLWLGSPSGSIATTVLAVVLHVYVTRWEEPVLVRRFGEPYLAYCEQVPRWVFGASQPGRAGGGTLG